MVLGLLNITYESIVVPYHDEQTPIDLIGKKMLPIFEFNKNKIMGESLDIIAQLDKDNSLHFDFYQSQKNEIDQWLNRIGNDVHSLCMPYWIWTPEFNDQSRAYFQKKKEEKRGPFKNLINNKDEFLNSLNITLTELEFNLSPFYKSNKLTLIDILLASHLWGMYIFPEYQFSPKIHAYLQSVKNLCHFDYHHDFWN